MDAILFSNFRKNLRYYLDKVRDDCEPIRVVSKDKSSDVVVINAKEYDNMVENLYIFSNPWLMKRLKKSIKNVNKGKAEQHNLLEANND